MRETLILQDILYTPRALQETLTALGGEPDDLAARMVASGVKRVVAVGNGTSYYAAATSAYLHNMLVPADGTLVWAVPTGDYNLYPAPLSARDVIVGVSVSGEVVDLLDLFERLRGHHRLAGISDVPGSSLTRLVDDLLLTKAGKSVVPTSTKTFVTTVAALDALWLGLLRAQGVGEAATPRQELQALPEQVAAGLDQASVHVPTLAERLAPCQRLFILGAGPSWCLAQEAALVFKEVSNVPTEAVQMREMMQGTTSVVDTTVGVIAINPPGRGQAIGRRVLDQCAVLGAVTVEVGTATEGNLHLDLRCSDLLSPIVYAGPLFLLASELAVLRGVDADHPHWEAGYLRETRRGASEPPNEPPL